MVVSFRDIETLKEASFRRQEIMSLVLDVLSLIY